MLNVVMIGAYPDDPSLIKGGVQASVYGLSQALRRNSSIASLIGFSLPSKALAAPLRTADIDGIEITYLNAPHGFLASGIIHVPLILRRIRQCSQPVVHVHGTGLLQLALLAALRLQRIPLVWTLHGITEKETWQRFRRRPSLTRFCRYGFYRAIERLSLRIAPQIIVDTDYVRQAIRTKKPVHVIPQGIWLEEWAGTATEAEPVPLVLSLGVLDPRKGHHLTLQAFAIVKQRGIAARLVIACAPTDPIYGEALKQQAVTLGIADHVRFAINRPRAEIIALLKQARIMALHSQEESQGIALCEALAAGVPVVATRRGGIPFVISDGKDGLLTDYGDAAAFADAMARLLTDNALYARMAAQAKRSAAHFNWSHIAEAIRALYRSAAAD